MPYTFPGGSSAPLIAQTLSSNSQTITFSGLDGDAHVAYQGLLQLDCSAGASASDGIFKPNGSSTNVTQTGMTSTFGGAPSGYTAASHFVMKQSIVLVRFTMYAKTGLKRLIFVDSHTDNGVAVDIRVCGVTWTDTSTKLTSLVIDGGIANAFKAGSYAAIWQMS